MLKHKFFAWVVFTLVAALVIPIVMKDAGGGVHGSATIAVLSGAVVLLLLMSRRRRSVKLTVAESGKPINRTSGLIPDLMRFLSAVGEVLALFIAWQIVHGVPNPESLIMGVGFGLIIGVAAHTAISDPFDSIVGSFQSTWSSIRSAPTRAVIAAVIGFIVGWLSGGGFGNGLLLAGAVLGIITGIKSRANLAHYRAAQAATAESVAAALGISTNALEVATWYVGRDGTVTIEQPGSALLQADRLADRVATLLPHLELTEASPARIVLSPLSEAGATARAHATASGGLITGTAAAPVVAPNSPPTVSGVVVPEHVISLEDL